MDNEEIVEWIIGDTQKPVSDVLVRYASVVFDGLGEIHKENVRLKKDADNALQFANTILTNLERGASVEDVLEWANSLEAKRLVGDFSGASTKPEGGSHDRTRL